MQSLCCSATPCSTACSSTPLSPQFAAAGFPNAAAFNRSEVAERIRRSFDAMVARSPIGGHLVSGRCRRAPTYLRGACRMQQKVPACAPPLSKTPAALVLRITPALPCPRPSCSTRGCTAARCIPLGRRLCHLAVRRWSALLGQAASLVAPQA